MIPSLLISLGVLATLLGIRNSLVFRERMKVINLISQEAQKDIANGRDWMWRYRDFDNVSYNWMVCEIWKPIKSYFHNAPCILPTPEAEQKP